MEIQHLREFVVISQSQSILEASKKLFLVPSTLSRHLSSLESEIGATLVHRTTTEFQLTPAGETFLENAISILEQYDKTLKATLLKQKNNWPTVQIGGHLRLAMAQKITMNSIGYITRNKLPVVPMVSDVLTSGSIATMAAHDPTKAMLDGAVQVSALIEGNADDFEGFKVDTLWEEPLRVALSEKHPLAKAQSDRIDLRDLEGSCFVLSTSYPALNQSILSVFETLGMRPRTVHKSARVWGDYYIDMSPVEAYLIPREDSGRISPTSISGLVVKKLSNPEAFMRVLTVRKADADEATELVAQTFQKVGIIMGEERLRRKKQRKHDQIAVL